MIVRMDQKKCSYADQTRIADGRLGVNYFTSEIFTIFSYHWYEEAEIAYCVFSMALPLKKSTEWKFWTPKAATEKNENSSYLWIR
jgi:hypothetical protein